ncbi:MAG TPA: F0F1 ATP synthase subunit B [Candidatus Acidoferrales bacterium]|nr:F0F1 ATP synthase subunit B [Candidatus Acidoferrales bacterium]
MFTIAAGGLHLAVPVVFAEAAGSGLVFNGFWIVIAAVNFLFFLVVIQQFAFGPVTQILARRRERIEQGLLDADAARKEREETALERNRVLSEARHQANEILDRAQKGAQEVRERDLAATREEIVRLRAQADAEIEADRQRTLVDVRGQIADLALSAAGRVLGETMTAARERRLVEQFLAETPVGSAGAGRPPTGGDAN